MTRATGFSLVELIVAIAVIALLLAIGLPALASARESARQSKSLTNVHGIAHVLDRYQAAYAEYYPFGQAGVFYPVTSEPAVRTTFAHFEFGWSWPSLVHQTSPWSEVADAWTSPPAQQSRLVPCDYRYAHTFLARPETWRDGAAADRSLLRGVRSGEVLFPASKVVMFDGAMRYLRRRERLNGAMLANPAPALFADAHAAVVSPADALPTAENPFLRGQDLATTPWNNTRDGVRGRDY